MLIKHTELYQRMRRLAPIPPEQWLRLETLLHPRRLEKGEQFVKPGDPSAEVGIVVRGLMRFYYVDASGREATKAFRGPHEMVAAYAEMLDGLPSRTTVEAVEDTDLIVMRYDRFTAFYPTHPCWQELGRKIAEDHYRQRERREQELLQLSATERWKSFLAEKPDLAARLPQKLIASYLGITQVAMSRIASAERGGPRKRRGRRKAR